MINKNVTILLFFTFFLVLTSVNVTATLSNQTISVPDEIYTSQTFTINHSFKCNTYDCSGVLRNVTFDSNFCSVNPSSNTNVTFSTLSADTIYLDSINIVCTVSETINLNISLNYNNTILSKSVTFNVTPRTLNPDEQNCLLYGTFANGTTCAMGESSKELNMLGIIIGYIALIVFFMFLGVFVNPHPFSPMKEKENDEENSEIDNLGLRFIFFGIAAFQVFFLVWVMYANYRGGDLTTILSVNFWIMMVLGIAAAFITMWKLTLIVWKPDHFDDNKREDKEW